MKLKGLLLAALSMSSMQSFAANDVYGHVSELIVRSGNEGDNAIYFRIDVIKENSTFETCIIDGNNMTWDLDLTSPVLNHQYQLIQRSYSEKLPLRIVGHKDVCANENVDSDKVFELSPWSWETYLNPTPAI
jgi:hypothetical protein